MADLTKVALWVVALLFASVEAKASPADWAVSNNEYGCQHVYRDQGLTRTFFAPRGSQYEVTMRIPLTGLTYPDSERAKVDAQTKAKPALNYRVLFNQDESRPTTAGYETLATVTISGSSELLDWMIQTEPLLELKYDDRVIADFKLTGIGDARLAFAGCRPVPVKPNRRLEPLRATNHWINGADYIGLMGSTTSVGPIVAELIVDAQGRVANCRVSTSSGIEAVDAQFCKDLQRRARFKAATDALGNYVAAAYTFRITEISF
jgi:hypothetical protein